jgi:hypothetical protein
VAPVTDAVEAPLATELDLSPPSAYGWLYAPARQFGFIRCDATGPSHYGHRLNIGPEHEAA